MGPLKGVKVLDLTSMVSGPVGAMILADQGAEVIKVEPVSGELVRHMAATHNGVNPVFFSCNRGKKSIALDLKSQEGKEILFKLAEDADVFMQNFRPGAIDRMGFGEKAIRKINQDIIYLSISGFGNEGPYANSRVYDPVIQAISGYASVQNNNQPDLVKNLICDKTTALTCAQGISAALFARERDPKKSGTNIDLSMLDAGLAFLWPDGMMNHTLLDDDVVTLPPLTKSYSLYKCKDGFLSIAALSDAQWFGIFRALGLPEYIEDERFNNAFARSENMVELVKSLTIFESLTVDDALQKLQDEDVPCSKTISLDELMTHPQIEANNLFQSINSDIQGKVRALRYPTKFDDNEMFNDKPAPALGEHKQEIIESLSN